MNSVIGYLDVDARQNVHRTFEYAGAGEIWNLHAARVEVTAYDRTFAVYKQPGERIDSWFQNRIGACHGSDNRDTSVMPGEYHMQSCYYHLGDLVLQGKMTLAPGWKLRDYGKSYTDGSPMVRVVRES